MGLIDLGNGIMVSDVSGPVQTFQRGMAMQQQKERDEQENQRGIRSLEIEQGKLDLERAKFEFQKGSPASTKDRSDAVQSMAKAFDSVALLAAQGNEGGATALLGQLFPDLKDRAAVIQSRDPALASKGVIDVIDVTNGSLLYSQNPFTDKRIAKDIDRRSDIIKKRVELGMERVVDVEKKRFDLAREISKEQGVSISEASDMSAETIEFSRSRDAETLFGKGHVGRIAPIGSLEKDQIAGIMGQQGVVRAATDRSPGGGRSLRAKSDLNKEQQDNIAASLEVVQNVSGRMIPLFSALTKEGSLLSRPGLIGGTVAQVRSKFKIGDPEYEVLKAFSDQTQWNELVKLAGTTFTENVKNEIQRLVPNEKDPLDVAMAKGAALLASTISLSHNKLDVWESSGKYTGNLRQLLDPNSDSRYTLAAGAEGVLGNLPAERVDRISETILSNLPTEVKNDSKLMGLFINAMPVTMKESLTKRTAATGQAPVESSIDFAKKRLGLLGND